MRRSVLLTVAALGGAACLIGGVGLFAALTDTAKTGPLTAESGGLAGSADVKLTTASAVDTNQDETFDRVSCDPNGWSDDLATDPTTISLGPGGGTSFFFCIRNDGSQPVSLTFDAFELVDVELDCTGDEAIFDPSCGVIAGTPGAGELSSVLDVAVGWYRECRLASPEMQSSGLKSLEGNPLGLTHGLGPAGAEPDCYGLTLSYPTGAGTPTDRIQAAQSDRVTWRFRFNASVPQS